MNSLAIFVTLFLVSGPILIVGEGLSASSIEHLEAGALDQLSHLELLKTSASSSDLELEPNRRITREYKSGSNRDSSQLQTISYVTNHGTKSKKSSSVSTIYNSRNYRFRTKNSVVSTTTTSTTTPPPSSEQIQDLEDSSTILSNSYSNEHEPSFHGKTFVSVTPFPHTLGPALDTALNAPAEAYSDSLSGHDSFDTSRPHRVTYANSNSKFSSGSAHTSSSDAYDSYTNYEDSTKATPSPEYSVPSSPYISPYETVSAPQGEYGIPPPPEPKVEYGPAYETYTEYGVPPPPPPNKEIKFIIHKPGEEEIVKDIIIENSKLSGEKISFLQGPDLSIHHKQKIYLAPPKKSVVYILLKEPEIKTQVLVQEPRPEDVPKPEVFVIYESSNGMIKRHYDLSPEEGQKVADVLANKIRWTRDGKSASLETAHSKQSISNSTTKSPRIRSLIRNPRNNHNNNHHNKDIKLLNDKKPNSSSSTSISSNNKESSSSSDEKIDSEIMNYFDTMKKQRKSIQQKSQRV